MAVSLPLAFMKAGARWVVASPAPIEDAEAPLFSTEYGAAFEPARILPLQSGTSACVPLASAVTNGPATLSFSTDY